MDTNRGVLGKGLRSLIPDPKDRGQHYWGSTIQTTQDTDAIVHVPVESVSPNPWQPRGAMDPERLRELADSIKEYGIIQPLIVTKTETGAYQLIAGERRLRAAESIGLKEVPVIIRDADEQKKLELSLIENIQRHNLNPLEEAMSYKRLMDEFNLTQEEAAHRVGKSRSTIANFLRLLGLPKLILEALQKEEITFSHAKVILSYQTEEEQLKAFKKIIGSKLTVAEATRFATSRPGALTQRDPVIVSWEQKLTSSLGFPAQIKKQGSGGIVEVHYTTDEDLKTLLDRLMGTNR